MGFAAPVANEKVLDEKPVALESELFWKENPEVPEVGWKEKPDVSEPDLAPKEKPLLIPVALVSLPNTKPELRVCESFFSSFVDDSAVSFFSSVTNGLDVSSEPDAVVLFDSIKYGTNMSTIWSIKTRTTGSYAVWIL